MPLVLSICKSLTTGKHKKEKTGGKEQAGKKKQEGKKDTYSGGKKGD